jgi:endonuclease YncB( thermonuclease family)
VRAKEVTVIDRDTLHARIGRTMERVRLIGMNAPASAPRFSVPLR